MHLVVDGTNVARSRELAALLGTAAPVEDASRHLVDLLASWAATAGARVDCCFDGPGPDHGSVGPVTVHAAGGRPADALVERLVREAAAAGGTDVVVVTDDRALADVAGAVAQRRWHVARLVSELGAGDPAGEANPAGAADSPGGTGHAGTAPPGLAGRLDEDVLARLERLRRGE